MNKIHISFSEYQSFKSCQHKHFLQNILKLEQPSNDILRFGSAIHKSIEEIINKNLTNPIVYANIFKGQIRKQFGKENIPFYLIDDGILLLRELNYFERYKDYDLIGSEEEINEELTTIDNILVNFKGFIDLTLQHKTTKQYIVIDFKSAFYNWDIIKKWNLKDEGNNIYQFTEESNDKTFFGQLALYKYYIAKRFNVTLDKIDTYYLTLSRKPSCIIQSYKIEYSNEFIDFIYNDVIEVTKQIINIDPMFLNKAKFNEYKSHCKNCFFAKDFCNNDKHQLIVI